MFLQIFRGGFLKFWGDGVPPNLGGFLQIFGGVPPGVPPHFTEGGSPPEYGQHSAGTHPTGMHSC